MQTTDSQPTANRLIHATSPYLLQHAYNPVDWHEWGSVALQKAIDLDLPILVSIGYSSCHWCHVMERECFENPDIAAIMNKHAVCIKVDREERPDIDHVYMEAVQSMGIHGGWPLNVFLTPDQRPFFGGTYFPPQNWTKLLLQLSDAYRTRRPEIDQAAGELTQHLGLGILQRFKSEPSEFPPSDFEAIFQKLESTFDHEHGGTDKAPKFVMPTVWMWLLRYHYQSGNRAALEMVTTTLRKIGRGGIYDQVGGGFARYSVDGRWFAPHFEKMLYDNAQLLSLYSEAWRLQPDPLFKSVVYQTVEWLKREMLHPDGGFYSALDADSEGEEGKYYAWEAQELDDLLGERADDVKHYYQVTTEGNWEKGRNILHCVDEPTDIETAKVVGEANKLLLSHRSKRVRPGLDDKILTGWNAMMIRGLLDAYNSFSDKTFLNLAVRNILFLEKNLLSGTTCLRSYRNKAGTTEGFLEDYAFMVQAYISFYQATFEESWIEKADRMCQYVIQEFTDKEDGFFHFAGARAEKLIAQKKELFDNVIPASNSVMARNLFLIGTFLDKPDLVEKSKQLVKALRSLVVSDPRDMSNWAILALDSVTPFYEVVISGPKALQFRSELARLGIPFCVLMGTTSKSNLPLVKDKSAGDGTWIYVCVNKTCQLPVRTVEEAMTQLKNRTRA